LNKFNGLTVTTLQQGSQNYTHMLLGIFSQGLLMTVKVKEGTALKFLGTNQNWINCSLNFIKKIQPQLF